MTWSLWDWLWALAHITGIAFFVTGSALCVALLVEQARIWRRRRR